MKAFNLKEYLKNPEKKVITRDGRGVRIRCTDRRGTDLPIVALVETSTGKAENLVSYREDGRWSPVGSLIVDSNLDLFFAPEKHEVWTNVYRRSSEDAYDIGLGCTYSSEEEAKEGIVPSLDCVATVKIEWEE